LMKWLQDDPNFGKAIQMREELAARAAGISAANVLDCLADIRRRNLGTDDRTAMIALEMIGKHLKMFRTHDDAPGSNRQLPAFVVGVQIQQTVQQPTDAKVIDVQVTEVLSND
ncbi:MAG: hypothetical protein ACRD3Q_08025, partial [Terriglobales bacterium]